MRLAQIENGLVVNVIEVDPQNVPEWAADWPEAGDAGPGSAYDGQTFTAPVEVGTVTAEDVKAEAMRRILAVAPEWKQRNLTAQAAILAKIGETNWTPEQAAAWAAGEALWGQIAAIRAASDLIETLDPIPTDYQNDQYWNQA